VQAGWSSSYGIFASVECPITRRLDYDIPPKRWAWTGGLPSGTWLAQTLAITRAELTESRTAFFVAWVLCLIFYFLQFFYLLQYALRSAPCVMIPELTTKFARTTPGVSSLLVMTLATGSVMFCLGSISMAESGPLLQAPARRLP
jgi:hypothetical protein